MVLLDNLPEKLQSKDPEERRIITGISWQQYESLSGEIGDSLAYLVSYFEGVLEIVAPSRRHEREKSRIGDLLLIYFLETNTEYFPMGSTTLRNLESQAAAEPDESYCIGFEKPLPDLVIEVIITSGSINRLELYQKLGIQEVWFWQNSQLTIYCLKQSTQTSAYEKTTRSEILPNLDINLLTGSVNNPNPLAAAKQFRQSLSSPE